MDFDQFIEKLNRGHTLFDRRKNFGHYDHVSIVQSYQSKDFYIERQWNIDDGDTRKVGFYTSVVDREEMMEFLRVVFRFGEYSSVLNGKNGFYFNRKDQAKEKTLLDYPGKAVLYVSLEPIEISYTMILPEGIDADIIP